MLKSLVWKEFREVLPICAMAMASQLLMIGYALNVWRLHKPRETYDVWPLLYLTTVLMAIALGIWQNVRDDQQGTFQFLLHRPARRSTIFAVRLLLGTVICLMVGVAPLVCFTMWVEGLAPNRGFGTWEPLRGLCAGVWLLYFGAFLSVLRPGRWYASRFLPLFAGILLFIVIQFFISSALEIQHSAYAYDAIRLLAWLMYLSALALGPLVALGFAIAALYVAETRDYA